MTTKTRFKELGFRMDSPYNWRIVDLSDDKSVGPSYFSKDELLADLNRYARQFGCDVPDGYVVVQAQAAIIGYVDVSEPMSEADARKYAESLINRDDAWMPGDYTRFVRIVPYEDRRVASMRRGESADSYHARTGKYIKPVYSK